MNTVVNMKTPEVVAPSISSAAMIVEFNASVWTARKKDHKASAEVTSSNGADKGVANVFKKILGDNDELEAVSKFVGMTRNKHTSMTMPWSDSGSRLLTTAAYFNYHQEMTSRQQTFNDLVDTFLQVYPFLIAGAQAKIGSLWRPNEYPTLDQVRQKFAFRLAYDELPDGGNTGIWLLDLPHEAMESVRNNSANNHQLRLKGAMDSIWHRLHESLTTLVHELDVNDKGKGNRLYDTVFTRAIELTEMLGTCNVTGDSQMEAMRRQLEDALNGTNVDQFKKSPTFREETRNKLKKAIASLPSLDM